MEIQYGIDLMDNIKETYEELIKKDFSEFELFESIKKIGMLIDISHELKEKNGLNIAIEIGNNLLKNPEMTSEQCFELYYYLGTAWSDLASVYRHETQKKYNLWDTSKERENEVICYRKALQYQDLNDSEMIKLIKCQILTNLGNTFSGMGRSVEAIEYWEKALNIDPNFGMAVGNLGYGLLHYALRLHDEGHKDLFIKYLYQKISTSLNNYLSIEAKTQFENIKLMIENSYLEEFLNSEDEYLDEFCEYHSEDEKNYRKWALRNRLFLNPLNDLFMKSIAERDVLSLPPILGEMHSKPYFHGLYNQLKQEYSTARYLYYEGISSNKTHFSDKGVTLVNTLDYSENSINLEKVKVAYRMAYSILDKVAYFIYLYFIEEFQTSGVNSRNIDFRTLWYNKKGKSMYINPFLKDTNNWALHGLFWLSKDIFNINLENPEDYENCMEPEAKRLNHIRNALEHRYIRIHKDCYDLEKDPFTEPENIAEDIVRSEFGEKTLKMLKLVRASLIYLPLAINIEENLKKENVAKHQNSISINMEDIRDEEKY